MKIWISALLVALTTTAYAEPDWCRPVEQKLMHGNVTDALTNPDPRRAIPSMLDVLCKSRKGSEEYARRPEVEAARQRMMKRLGMVEADWADAGEWAAEHQGKLMSSSLDYDRKKAWSALTPIEQYTAIVKDSDASYYADAFGTGLSEVGRFGFIADCISHDNVVGWAICQPDIDQLDRVKLRSELRTSQGSTGYERMALRIDAYELEDKLVAHAAKVKAAIAKDPAYATVFQTAVAGRKRWSTTDAKLADLALAMDDARITRSRKAYDSCAEKTWSALAGVIAKIPAARLADAAVREAASASPLERAATIIVGEPDGYLAAVAYVTCKGADERADYLARSLAGALQRWSGHRGPRTMALTAVFNAGIELDDRDAKIDYPVPTRNWFTGPAANGSTGGGTGVIASVKITGDKAVITFVKKLANVTYCSQWKQTNRIVGITNQGYFIYGQTCLGHKTEAVNQADKPQTVDARYAATLAPGMLVWTADEVVMFAWTKPAAKLPAQVAGVAVR